MVDQMAIANDFLVRAVYPAHKLRQAGCALSVWCEWQRDKVGKEMFFLDVGGPSEG